MDDIFEDFFPNGLKSLEKDFFVDPVWKGEINKWLVCIRDIDRQYYKRAKTRVKQDIWKQEETLAELRSIYFLKAQKELNILLLEPNLVDICFADRGDKRWFAEIKCPSYVKEILQRDLSLEAKFKRKQQPKNIPESFSFDFNGYTDAIKKSVDKFQVGENNLLIISDDRMVSLIGDPFFEENITKELKREDPQGKISAVLLLNVQGRLLGNLKTNVEYNSRVAIISSELFL